MCKEVVAVLGASSKPERYAFKAIVLLKEVDGIPVVKNLDLINKNIGTLTLYVGPDRIKPMIDSIVRLKPQRVIFNPGTESPELAQRLDEAGIEYFEACTLVLLNTNQF
jgi:predicted CoA-binding protein